MAHLVVIHGFSNSVSGRVSERASHSGLLEPRGTGIVMKEPGVRDMATCQ
jgi:hypothetical protein